MSDLFFALLVGAVVVALAVCGIVDQHRWRQRHLADVRRALETGGGTCPAWFEASCGRHHPCDRERGHVGYHHWKRSVGA